MADLRVIDGGGPSGRAKIAERDLRDALRIAAANMLRIIRGAGKPDELIVQLHNVVQSAIMFKDDVGHWPSSDLLAEMVALKHDVDEIRAERASGGLNQEDIDRLYESGRMDRKYAEQSIKTGVLQVIASQLVHQDLQERHGQSELERGIDQAIKANEKRTKYWEAKNSPPGKSRRKKLTPAPRRFGSKLDRPGDE
jgi:hypothetical protein